MQNPDLKKRLLYFLIFLAIVSIILIAFPYVESSVRSYLEQRFEGTFQDGIFTRRSGEPVPPMVSTMISLVTTVIGLIWVFVVMALIVTVVRFLFYFATRTLYRNSAPGEVSSILQTVVSVILYIVAFFVIFQTQFPTVQLAPLFTGSTIIGIVVGLALQDTLGNLFSGLALQADQPFQVGDVVRITGRGEGVVEKVSWRGVAIRTFQNKLLVISNSVLGKETVEVAPKNNLNATSVFFNTEYSFSPARTIQLVRDAVRQVENVSRKMRPNVRIRNLGESSIDYEVKYWLDDYTRIHDTDALIRQRIWYVFQREKIKFAFPSRIIHEMPRSVDVEPDVVFDSISERLTRVSIFNPLSDEEIQRLVNASTSRVYAPGEPIVRSGQVGNSMFVIIRGSVKVQIPEQNYQKTINTLGENDFFGEMSLLTGEPRSANVIAVEETEVLRIDKDGLKPILASNPALVETISDLVEERRKRLTGPTDFDDEEEDVAGPQKSALRTIRKFFGLK